MQLQHVEITHDPSDFEFKRSAATEQECLQGLANCCAIPREKMGNHRYCTPQSLAEPVQQKLFSAVQSELPKPACALD